MSWVGALSSDLEQLFAIAISCLIIQTNMLPRCSKTLNVTINGFQSIRGIKHLRMRRRWKIFEW